MAESTKYLAQSRTFEISSTQGELTEVDLFGTSAAVVNLTDTIVDSKYKILELLGHGGMGAVYRARHLMLDKDIALKTVRSSTSSQEALERFSREVRAVARLGHPNIVLVFDSGISEANQPYYTMELLIGQSLQDKLDASGYLPMDEALAIFAEVAEGLRSAHNNGIVHRDLKPANIFLLAPQPQSGKQSRAKIVDFGIAKLADNSARSQSLTRSGTVFGSPLYMSPEQSRGDEVDKRSDIYSFGCALFESLTGHPPFVGEHALETIMMHQTVSPPRLSQRLRGKTFPPMLESFVGRLLQKEPDQRPQSFEEVLDTIRRIRKLNDLSSTAPAPPAVLANASAGGIGNVDPTHFLKKHLILSVAVATLAGFSIAATFLILDPFNLRKAMSVQPGKTSANSPGAMPFAATTIGPAGSTSRHDTSPPQPTKDSRGDLDDAASFLEAGQTVMRKPLPAHQISIDPGVEKYVYIGTILTSQNIDTISRSSITNLDLRRCQFDNFQLAKFSKMKLRELYLAVTNFDDDGAKALTGLKYLTRLSVDGSEITDKACQFIVQYPALHALDVSRTRVTDEGLSYLAQIPQLDELHLDNNNSVTMGAMIKLCQRARLLKLLYVSHCKNLEKKEVQFLRDRFPGLTIHYDEPIVDSKSQDGFVKGFDQ